MNILVTGATGFIGTNLTRELRKQHHLFILGQFDGDPEKLGLPGIIMTDDIQRLADYIKDNKIEGVIHLASLYLTVHTPEQVKDLVSSNVYFGTAVLEAASLTGCVKWFLNTGSIWQNYNTKGTEYNPVNLYAATKQAFIDMAKYYSDVFGIKFCTLKLCDTYGPNDTRKKIFKLFKDYSESGEVLKMSPGEQLIDLIYITDITAGFTHLAELLDKTVGKLVEQGIVDKCDILFTHIGFEKYANIIFTKPIYEARKTVRGFLSSIGIETIGRFGEWDYLWSDQALISGSKIN